MGKVEIIKSALKFLVQKQIKQGSWGFSDADDDEISWDEVIGWLEQQPCKDCINRESVIEWLKDKDIIKTKNQEENARRELDELPSVTPQPKMGEWIFVHPLQEDDEGAYMCSCCGVGNWGIDPKVDKYCFNCGAKMENEDAE